VVAAGVIVVVALSGLLATGIPFVGRMGVGSAIVVAAVAVGAITVLPTLMGAFARRLRPKDPAHVAPSAGFAHWGERITRRPWLAAGAGTLAMLILAAPFTGLRLGQPDDGNDSEGTVTRVAYDRLAEGFGPGFNGPLVIAVDTPAGADGARAVAACRRPSPARQASPPRHPPSATRRATRPRSR
jgi:RND superfamily putative drug exporter